MIRVEIKKGKGESLSSLLERNQAHPLIQQLPSFNHLFSSNPPPQQQQSSTGKKGTETGKRGKGKGTKNKGTGKGKGGKGKGKNTIHSRASNEGVSEPLQLNS